mgnify:CR=1 FL=1
MDPIRWLLRMSQWSRHPPAGWRVKLMIGVLILCLGLAGLQKLGLWPDWLTVNGRANLR